MVRPDSERSTFEKSSEVPDPVVNSQQFAIVRTVVQFSFRELSREKCEWNEIFAVLLLEFRPDGGVRVVDGQVSLGRRRGVVQESGTRQRFLGCGKGLCTRLSK